MANGLKFSPAPQSIPVKKKIVATVEPALNKALEQTAMKARVRIVSLLSKADLPNINITAEEKHAIHTFKNDIDLIILPADKGCATVLWTAIITR